MRISGKIGYLLFVTSLSLCLSCGTSQAISSEHIIMTRQQFNQLEKNNNEALELIKESRKELVTSRELLNKQSNQLEKVKQDLNEQKESLVKANTYLKIYEEQTKREKQKLKRQRNSFAFLLAVIGTAYILK